MVEEGPVIYLFDGDDEFAINDSIHKLRLRLGEATIADMNTTRLDGVTCSLTELEDAVAAVPFIAPKRLVILTQPTARYKDPVQQARFLKFLNANKPTTKLVLVEYDFLTTERERREGKLNWLEDWASSPNQAKRVFTRHHPQPFGGSMVRWIQDYAKSMGGQFSAQAAVALASQIGDNNRMAAQEISKLLTYVNYARSVEADDVEHLTPFTAKMGDFELVNALRDRDRRKAQALLHRSLEEDDPLRILQSIVFQFRTLIIASEILQEHGSVNDFPRSLKIGSYPARLAMQSAARFSMPDLEKIYHRLLEIDEDGKTGQMDADLALELLVIELTA